MDHSNHHQHDHAHHAMDTSTMGHDEHQHHTMVTDNPAPLMTGDMDHSMHNMGTDPEAPHHMMMKMFFHGGYTEVILFDFWRINSIGGLIGSMIGCFLMGVLYEGLKFYREHLFRANFQPVRYNDEPAAIENGSGEKLDPTPTSPAERNEAVRTVETCVWSKAHFLLTFLHMIQMILAYFLMLIFMTYNTWLCAAVVLGATCGYFLFGWRKTVLLDVSDHCH